MDELSESRGKMGLQRTKKKKKQWHIGDGGGGIGRCHGRGLLPWGETGVLGR
jgi:hypothetical protein